MTDVEQGQVVVLVKRLGPYHVARLQCASSQIQLHVIQACHKDSIYAWDRSDYEGAFQCTTLMSDDSNWKRRDLNLGRRMKEALDQTRPSLAVVSGWAELPALSALCWCTMRHVPAVVMSESQAIDEPRSAWREAVKRQIVGLCSSALVGGSPHIDYAVQLGLPRERVFPGYDSVDNQYFAAGVAKVRSEERSTRGQYGLRERFFLASARFIEKKNLPRLLQAYAQYRQKAEKLKSEALKHRNTEELVQPWDLVMLGDGELRPALTSLRSALGLNACVHMPGFKQYPDLPAYYGLASAFVHASTTEQWGLVVNEAMASGLPVLVSNRCGCAPDLVENGVNGFTFDPYDIEGMARLMHRITETPKHRLAEMGAASQRIISEWGPERFASGLKAAVDTALEVGPIKPTFVQMAILKALLLR